MKPRWHIPYTTLFRSHGYAIDCVTAELYRQLTLDDLKTYTWNVYRATLQYDSQDSQDSQIDSYTLVKNDLKEYYKIETSLPTSSTDSTSKNITYGIKNVFTDTVKTSDKVNAYYYMIVGTKDGADTIYLSGSITLRN